MGLLVIQSLSAYATELGTKEEQEETYLVCESSDLPVQSPLELAEDSMVEKVGVASAVVVPSLFVWKLSGSNENRLRGDVWKKAFDLLNADDEQRLAVKKLFDVNKEFMKFIADHGLEKRYRDLQQLQQLQRSFNGANLLQGIQDTRAVSAFDELYARRLKTEVEVRNAKTRFNRAFEQFKRADAKSPALAIRYQSAREYLDALRRKSPDLSKRLGRETAKRIAATQTRRVAMGGGLIATFLAATAYIISEDLAAAYVSESSRDDDSETDIEAAVYIQILKCLAKELDLH